MNIQKIISRYSVAGIISRYSAVGIVVVIKNLTDVGRDAFVRSHTGPCRCCDEASQTNDLLEQTYCEYDKQKNAIDMAIDKNYTDCVIRGVFWPLIPLKYIVPNMMMGWRDSRTQRTIVEYQKKIVLCAKYYFVKWTRKE